MFKDQEFKYCKNQHLRYWYLVNLLDTEKSKNISILEKAWIIYNEIKNK